MNRVKILVVDDEPDVAKLVERRFRRQIKEGEFEFCFAMDGQDALDRLAGVVDIDIVLTDINMPRMDGLTLLSRLNDIGDELCALVVSAYGDMDNIRIAMNRGAFDFVTKPIDFEDLETTIRKAILNLMKFRKAHEDKAFAERAQATLSRYFSPNLVRELVDNPKLLDAGAERRELTFVFTDVTDFTPLVERMSPELISPIINEYLTGMTQVIFDHGGTVDKIVGDAVHAMFGAPMKQADHAKTGIECALALDEFAESFRARHWQGGIAFGVTRIGVHTGPAIVGNFGGDSFFDFTAYGDSVNTAARLQNANKYLGTRICASADTVTRVGGVNVRSIGTLLLKGKSKGIEAFEPLSGDMAALAPLSAYEQAFAALKDGSPEASKLFASLVADHGKDPLAVFHLQRLLAGQCDVSIKLQ